MPTKFKSRKRWGIALLTAALTCGTLGATAAQAQSIPVVPVVIVPVTPVVTGISVPVVHPPIAVGSIGRSRDEVTWSKSGRARVDVSVQQHHGRAVAP